MALISRVQKSRLSFSARLDAEHYSPRFHPVLGQLQKNHTVKLRSTLLEPVKTGHTPSTKVPTYYNPGLVKFVKTDNLREDRIEMYEVQMLSEAGNSKIAASELRPNDVIVTIIGATEEIIGRAARVHFDLGRANINQNIALIRSSIPSGYLTTFLNTKYGREQLIWLSRQTGQVNLNCREVEELAVPLFSETFVNAINGLNLKRHNLLGESVRIYAQAEQLLLTELGLQDWIPAHALSYVRHYHQVVQEHRADAEYFQPKYEAMFDKLRDAVRLVRLGRLAARTKGIEVGGAAYADWGIPFWRVSNLSKFGLDDSSMNYISRELYELLRADHEPRQGELLLSKDATPGVAFYLEDRIEGIISSGILRLTPIANIPARYLEIVLNSVFVQMQIERSAGGSVIKHWKPAEVARTLVSRLPPEKEDEIAALVQRSHSARKEANALFEQAKSVVEVAIQEGIERAMALLH